MGRLRRRVTWRGTSAQIRYVTPVPPGSAPGAVARVYDQLERDFGILAPPVTLHSPSPEVLAACWSMLRETLIAGTAGRAAREAVAAGVSLGNTCPYCVQVHTTLLYGLAGGRDVTAIGTGRMEEVGDDRIRRIAEWARASGLRGTAGDPPVPAAQWSELIGVAVTFHYLNRMVNVFLGDPPIPPGLPGTARGLMMRALGLLLRPVTTRRTEPGAALALLPAATPVGDLGWASGTVLQAFAQAVAAVDAAGERSVPEPVRDLVTAELDRWDGSPPGLDSAWLDTAMTALPPEHRPAGRLALLTALASYRVREADIDAVRATGVDDRSLVELTAWAALTAARRIGAWLANPRATAQAEKTPDSSRGDA